MNYFVKIDDLYILKHVLVSSIQITDVDNFKRTKWADLSLVRGKLWLHKEFGSNNTLCVWFQIFKDDFGNLKFNAKKEAKEVGNYDISILINDFGDALISKVKSMLERGASYQEVYSLNETDLVYISK